MQQRKLQVPCLATRTTGRFWSSVCCQSWLPRTTPEVWPLLKDVRVMGSQSGDYASLSGQDRYSGDLGSQSLDLRSYNAPQGLDDSQRPSMDNPVIAEVPENLPPAKYSTTYEELRRRNRDEYERRLSAPPPPSQLPPPALSQQPPLTPSQPPVLPPSKSFDGRTERGYPTRIPSSAPSGGGTGKKNKYGDTWED
nr:OCIA domain-containing protein 1-like [Rhipicephalus microplus]